MERIFIDRENSIAYAVLAIDSIYHSANRKRSINDFVEEIKTMFDVHQDQEQLKQIMKKLLNNKKTKLMITVDMKTK